MRENPGIIDPDILAALKPPQGTSAERYANQLLLSAIKVSNVVDVLETNTSGGKIPSKGEGVRQYVVNLTNRYGIVAGTDGDRAIAYVERIIDRQLNKARGILTFNSLLLATIKLEIDSHRAASSAAKLLFPAAGDVSNVATLLVPALVVNVISSTLLLRLLSVHWMGPQDVIAELVSGMEVSRKRSCLIQWSIYFSLASLLALAAVVLWS